MSVWPWQVVHAFVPTLVESPEWVASRRKLDQAVSNIAEISRTNKSHFRLLTNDLRAVPVDKAIGVEAYDLAHYRELFAGKALAFSTSSLMFLWLSIGLAYVPTKDSHQW